MRFWSVVWIGLSAAVFIDFMAWILFGSGIGELLGGTSSPVVVAIAEQISGMSSWMFWLINLIAVLVCSYVLYVCSKAYLEKGDVL